MGSLQDQLLKAGLISEDALKKSRADAYKTRKRAAKPPKSRRDKPRNNPQRAAETHKRARDRELNRERDANRERKARIARLRDFTEQHKLNDASGEIRHYVSAGRKIKHVYVTPEQHRQLAAGELIVAVIEGRPKLLPGSLEERLRAIDPDVRIATARDEAPGEDDAYANFQVPDDLMW